MLQLKMCRRAQDVQNRPLPEGFRFVRYTGTAHETEEWLRLCTGSLLPDNDPHWFADTIQNYPDLDPANDLIFVCKGEAFAATCAFVRHANGEGYLHMVAADPAYRRLGIGHAMVAYAARVLDGRGCPVTVLTTDDFRIPAIKSYLDAGFLPVRESDPESDIAARWQAVLTQIGKPDTPWFT